MVENGFCVVCGEQILEKRLKYSDKTCCPFCEAIEKVGEMNPSTRTLLNKYNGVHVNNLMDDVNEKLQVIFLKAAIVGTQDDDEEEEDEEAFFATLKEFIINIVNNLSCDLSFRYSEEIARRERERNL